MGFGQRKHARKILEIHADAQGVADSVVPHVRHQVVEAACEIGKIQVTVGVNEHGRSSRQRGIQEASSSTCHLCKRMSEFFTNVLMS
jgi:hypothetical protein